MGRGGGVDQLSARCSRALGAALFMCLILWCSHGWAGEVRVSLGDIGYPSGVMIPGPRGEVSLLLPVPGSSPGGRIELSYVCPPGVSGGALGIAVDGVDGGTIPIGPGSGRASFRLPGASAKGRILVRLRASLAGPGALWDDPTAENLGLKLGADSEMVLDGPVTPPKGISQWIGSLSGSVAVVVPDKPKDEELSAAFGVLGMLVRRLPHRNVSLIRSSEEVSAVDSLRIRIQMDPGRAEGALVGGGGRWILINGSSRESLVMLCSRLFDPKFQGVLQGAEATNLQGGGTGGGPSWRYEPISRSWSSSWGVERGILSFVGAVPRRVRVSLRGVVPASVRDPEVALDLYINGDLVGSVKLGSGGFSKDLSVPEWVRIYPRNKVAMVFRGAGGPPSVGVDSVAMGDLRESPFDLADLPAYLEGASLLVDRNLRWTGVKGAGSIFAWLASYLPDGHPAFPRVTTYESTFSPPKGIMISVSSRIPETMSDRLRVLVSDGGVKVKAPRVEANLSDRSFSLMGQALDGDGGMAVLVTSAVEALPRAAVALMDTPQRDLAGDVFFYSDGGGVKIWDLEEPQRRSLLAGLCGWLRRLDPKVRLPFQWPLDGRLTICVLGGAAVLLGVLALWLTRSWDTRRRRRNRIRKRYI